MISNWAVSSRSFPLGPLALSCGVRRTHLLDTQSSLWETALRFRKGDLTQSASFSSPSSAAFPSHSRRRGTSGVSRTRVMTALRVVSPFNWKCFRARQQLQAFSLTHITPSLLRVRQESAANLSALAHATSRGPRQDERNRSLPRPSSSSRPHNPRQTRGRVPQRGGEASKSDSWDEPQHAPEPVSVGRGKHQFFATCHPGLEEVVASELKSSNIGAMSVQPGSAGVAFSGDLATGLRANLWLRCATRVLVQLGRAKLDQRLPAGDSIYSFVRQAAPWHALLEDPRGHEDRIQRRSKHAPEDQSSHPQHSEGTARTFSVDSRVWDCPGLTSTQLASVRAKDAVCDAIRDAYGGAKPPVPEREAGADLPLFLAVYRDEATLYRDMSGRSLHKRGYRRAMHKASLNEAVAAAVLLLAGWGRAADLQPGGGPREVAILDPMCGSGTLLIEAALLATRTAPGLFRPHWPFLTWHDVTQAEWASCVEAARQQQQRCPEGVRLLGCDIHGGALSLCERDAESAGVLGLIELACSDCREYTPPVAPSLVVVNPPWGSRLGGTSGEEGEWLSETWFGLGRFLREHCADSQLMVVSGNPTVTQKLFLRASEKWPVTVGGIECRILSYQLLPKRKPDAAVAGPLTLEQQAEG